MTVYLSVAGLLVLLYRLQPWRRLQPPLTSREPFVSIIVPSRNEEKNLPPLLTSLESLDYKRYEVIVVDDNSTDQTFAVASGYQFANVVRAPAKPDGWAGKNWACWQGAGIAKGELLLFTDADTVHARDSLRKAVAAFEAERAEIMSAPPFHECRNFWEKLLGAFHLFPLIVTSYRQKPSSERLFAIGQYLMFTSESYRALYGHSAVKASLAEDIDLAHLWRHQGCRYLVYPYSGLYSVQMFGSFREFWNGWRRLLRLGLGRSHIGSIMEIAVVLHCLSFGFGTGGAWPFFIGLLIVAWTQRQTGRFALVGALASPISCFLFIALSLAAVVDRVFNKQIVWRGRAYSPMIGK